MGDLGFVFRAFWITRYGRRVFFLLGIDGALLFGGEEQSEQVVQQSVSQQNEVGRQETAEIVIITWRHNKVFMRKVLIQPG